MPSCFFFQAEDGIRDGTVTGVQTCALPISALAPPAERAAPGPAVLLAAGGPAYGAVALPAEPATIAVQLASAADEAPGPPGAGEAPGRPAVPPAEVIAEVDDLVLPTAPLAATLAAAAAVRRA